jgi:hypothetical protein
VIYDRPVTELMVDAADAMSAPFTFQDIGRWFSEHYPKIKMTTIRAHVVGFTSNNPTRRYYRAAASRPPLFFRQEDGSLERYDADKHLGVGDTAPGAADSALSPDDLADVVGAEQIAEFAMESHLESFLINNWESINWGRQLQEWTGPGAERGNQLRTPVGILDFLCVDTASKALVVVELKKGRPSDRVVGQLARYIGYVKTHIAAPGQAVEGLIVAHETDDQLRYAASAMPGVQVVTYEVKFALQPVHIPVGA